MTVINNAVIRDSASCREYGYSLPYMVEYSPHWDAQTTPDGGYIALVDSNGGNGGWTGNSAKAELWNVVVGEPIPTDEGLRYPRTATLVARVEYVIGGERDGEPVIHNQALWARALEIHDDPGRFYEPRASRLGNSPASEQAHQVGRFLGCCGK